MSARDTERLDWYFNQSRFEVRPASITEGLSFLLFDRALPASGNVWRRPPEKTGDHHEPFDYSESQMAFPCFREAIDRARELEASTCSHHVVRKGSLTCASCGVQMTRNLRRASGGPDFVPVYQLAPAPEESP